MLFGAFSFSKCFWTTPCQTSSSSNVLWRVRVCVHGLRAPVQAVRELDIEPAFEALLVLMTPYLATQRDERGPNGRDGPSTGTAIHGTLRTTDPAVAERYGLQEYEEGALYARGETHRNGRRGGWSPP